MVKLAAALVLPEGKPAQVIVEERWLLPAFLELISESYEVNTNTTGTTEEDDWRKPFLDYFNHGSLPDDSMQRRQLQRRLPSYVHIAGVLYRRAYGH